MTDETHQMSAPGVNRALEWLRIAGVGGGFALVSVHGDDPVAQLSILQLCVVVSLAGLTGIESVFFPAGAARLAGYGQGSPYQRQSGMNNLAVALVSLLVFLARWDAQAQAAVLLVLLVFLALSAVNHALVGLTAEHRSARAFTRPLGTVLLIASTAPFIVRALA